jgi:hypothetical protein
MYIPGVRFTAQKIITGNVFQLVFLQGDLIRMPYALQ